MHLYIYMGLQILALTLLHIHTLPGGPLPLLCSRAHAGCPCPGSVPCGAAGWPAAGGMANGVVLPGAGEKPLAFCRTLVLFSQKENSRNCVWVAGGLSPCECVC